MKRVLLPVILITILTHCAYSNGVLFDLSEKGAYLKLISSDTEVNIENQVAITVTKQTFENNLRNGLFVKYAFPLPESASAIKLRYHLNETWYTAQFSAVPQDTATVEPEGPGIGEDFNLKAYLGKNPLFYNIEDTILMESSIIIELTYVELLKSEFGKINYCFPNDYSEIQSTTLNELRLNVNLNSERTVSDIDLLSHSPRNIINYGNKATIEYSVIDKKADLDYHIQYSLSLEELGLFSLSTFIDDTLQKDDHGRGFFAFIIEPDPSENAEVINKTFTLIIDRSGSMSGQKIIQARDAATFITNNLNENDKFNIISFSSDVTSFRSEHVEYNETNKEAALNYINSLDATGSTNISGAFDMAVPQFSFANENSANIIIFFTDGEQTTGITNTDQLIDHINALITESEKQISLFTFGIGSSTNQRLLVNIAKSNSGLAEFLANDELEDVITNFYMAIKNPVLLNTGIEFSPAVINELYPSDLQNLYVGQQMILVGRYTERADVTFTLSGIAYSKSVSYTYKPSLSDSTNYKYQFLTKLWAKMKIDDLVSAYYLNLNNSSVADSIKDEVIEISMDYGVISPFTSFQGGVEDNSDTRYYATTSLEYDLPDFDKRNEDLPQNEYIQLLSVWPNPCSHVLNVDLQTTSLTAGTVEVTLVNGRGTPVYFVTQDVMMNNYYQVNIDTDQLNIPQGVYYLMIVYDNKVLAYKVVLV